MSFICILKYLEHSHFPLSLNERQFWKGSLSVDNTRLQDLMVGSVLNFKFKTLKFYQQLRTVLKKTATFLKDTSADLHLLEQLFDRHVLFWIFQHDFSNCHLEVFLSHMYSAFSESVHSCFSTYRLERNLVLEIFLSAK